MAEPHNLCGIVSREHHWILAPNLRQQKNSWGGETNKHNKSSQASESLSSSRKETSLSCS